MALGSDRRRLRVGNRREWQIARAAQRKVVLRGGRAPRSAIRKPVSGDTECRMMVEAAPPASVIIAKAEFLLELLIIALDPPPQLCQIDQTIEGGIFGQGGKTNTWSARFRLRATRSYRLPMIPIWGSSEVGISVSATTLQRATRSANYRDAPAALSVGQSARRANPWFPRAK